MSAVSAQVIKGAGWTSVPFGQVATLINGRAYKKSELLDEGTPVLRIQNLNGGDRWYYSNLQLPQDKYCDRDDLLFAWSASFGPYIWDGDKAIYHYHIWKVIPGPRLDKRFAFYLLGFLTQSVKDAAHGVAMLHITKGKMEAWEIPLPPLAEQKRIAEILDAADTLRAKRRESLTQLDTLLQSTFLDMFGDPVANPMGWEVAELRNHTSKVGSGATPKGGNDSYKAEGIALIRSLNVRDGVFRWKNLARIDDAQASKLSNVVAEENDVLLNITGASVARVCRAPEDVVPARVNQHVCIIRTTSTIEPCFLEKLLLAGSMKRKLLGIGESGATRQAITKAEVLALEVPLPPLDLQRRFAAIVESVEQQKARQRAHLDELDTLFASLQSRAFRGDL